MSHRLHVEKALTAYYLGTESGNGAGPVRFIDASRTALAKALGPLAGEDAVSSLANACDGPIETAQVLAFGWSGRWPDSQCPGYLRFLVLTCAVVSIADGADSREFGLNLASLWDCENIFSNRTALPELWAKLAAWCRARRSKGAQIREFLLPSSGRAAALRPRLGNVRYLRLNYEIAFPTWRDLSHLRVVLGRRPDLVQACADPFEAARLICPVIELDQGFSPAMRLASGEFKKLYEAKATLLRLHRFWGVLSNVLDEGGARTPLAPKLASLVISLGSGIEDSEAIVRLSTDRTTPSESTTAEELDGPASVIVEKASDWLKRRGGALSRSPLVRALDSGAVLLFETSFARWESSDDVASERGRCILLLNEQQRKDLAGVGRAMGRLSGRWSLFGPLDGLGKSALLSKLGMGGITPLSVVGAIRIHGGIRVGTAFLGRPDFLPRIAVWGPGTVRLYLALDDCDSKVNLIQTAAGEFTLEASSSLQGRVTVRLEEAPVEGIDPLVFERQLTFVRDAVEHAALRSIDKTKWTPVEEVLCVPVDEIRASEEISQQEQHQTPTARRMRDLGEAVYARGLSGWSEADLVALLVGTIGSEGPSVWDVLRGLQEVGWLYPTIATTWRVRRWWLRPPALAVVRAGQMNRTFLVGSVPDVLVRRFSGTVREAGGGLLSAGAPSEYCLPPFGAVGVETHELVNELRWTLASVPGRVPASAPSCWPVTDQEPSRHEAAAAWNLEVGRFEACDASEHTAVGLFRHRRQAGDRPDLYSLRNSTAEPAWFTLSRTAAVIEAYRRARKPMFAAVGTWLVRLTNDGFLPLPLAEAAILRTGRASGPFKEGKRWTYAYPLDDVLLRDVRALFGSHFVRDVPTESEASRVSRATAAVVGRARARGTTRVPAYSASRQGVR